jgi:hypothetical protein
LTDNEIVECVLTCCKRRLQNISLEYSHTLAFEYKEDMETLFVSWCKVNTDDVFSKSKGYKIAIKRLERLIDVHIGNKDYYGSWDRCPRNLRKSIDEHIPRVKRYFKNMKDDFDIVIY